MKGETMENGGDEKGDVPAQSVSADRRLSLVTLQNMLKRVPQTPSQHQHEEDKRRSEQPAAREPANPFYAHYLESAITGHQRAEALASSQEGHSNGPAPHRNSFVNGGFQNVTLDSPDSVQSSERSKESPDDLFKLPRKEVSVKALMAKRSNPFEKTPSALVDPFMPQQNAALDPFRSPQPAGNPFEMKQNPPTTQVNTHYTVSNSSTETTDPFQSPVSRTLFQDLSNVEDPFGPTPGKQPNPFHSEAGSPDLFQPLSSKAKSKFEGTLSKDDLIGLPSERKSDGIDSSKKSRPPPPVPPKPPQKPPQIVLVPDEEAEKEPPIPTPFLMAGNLSVSPGEPPAYGNRTSLRPPKPQPRTKPPRPMRVQRPETSPNPANQPLATIPVPSEAPEPKLSPKMSPELSPKLPKPLPKQLLRLKPKTPEKKVKTEDYVVLDDILFIGQEKCVEDWPEDSPQLKPDFRPSGKFKLRRESIMMANDDDMVANQEDTQSINKKLKKKMSMMVKRSSKDKIFDDPQTTSKTLATPRKSSQDYFSDPQMSAEELEDEEQITMDYRKKTLKTKVSKLLRRSSTGHTTGHSIKDDDLEKKGIRKKDSVRRWSEGPPLEGSTGEDEDGGDSNHSDEKRKKKHKFRLRTHRGFNLTPEKNDNEPRGAYRYTPRKGSKTDDEPRGAYGYTPRKGSKDSSLIDNNYEKSKSSFSLNSLDDEEQNQLDHFTQNGLTVDEMTDFTNKTLESEEDKSDSIKVKKQMKIKGLKRFKQKNKQQDVEWEEPQGAASSDFLSEAAKAEWMAAQRDGQVQDELEDEDEDGDTDSLMEWWDTVEQWDELPSDEEGGDMKEDESKSFSVLANKVHRGLRLFNKMFTERAEVLWHSIITLHAIADDINEFHQKAKIASVTGGTTTAVGGVTAIAGLALAPVTLGVSLIITAVGVGVATAGGIASASAAISDNVNNTNDRKKVEQLLEEYEDHLLDLSKVLHFVNHGLYKLRGHPFLRTGTQHYSEDWETRRAVQMISLADSPVMEATEVTDGAVASLQGLFKGMDKYFIKDSRELKKGCRKEVVTQIKRVAGVLNDAIVQLNAIREQLQEDMGGT